MKRILKTTIFFLFIVLIAKANNLVFSSINVSHGLSDNQIRYILQLPDQRMVITTSGNLNLYDGTRFSYIHRTSEHIFPLKKYNGFYRVYCDNDSLLWIKESHKLMCVNLSQENYVANLSDYFICRGVNDSIQDLFMDSDHRLWLLTDNGLVCLETLELLDISENTGDLQDVDSYDDNLYLFYNTGNVCCYDLKTKKKQEQVAAYSVEEQKLFRNTSLVVKGKDGFYQLRNGEKGGFFYFDIYNRTWEKKLETDYSLNTLILGPDDEAYISSSNGLWIINCQNNEQKYLPVLKTVEGDVIDTEISTLFYDKQGGLWLGTLNRGLLYYHPFRNKFTHIGRSYFNESSTKDIIVQSFAEDNHGYIYVKAYSDYVKYYKYNHSNRTLLNKPFNTLPTDVLRQLNASSVRTYNEQHYNVLLTDSRNWVWAGTQDGLKLFKGEQEESYYTEDGLSNNFIHGILEDQSKTVWITTSYGITRVQVDSVTDNLTFFNYNTYDGTLSGEYSDGALFEGRDGTIYFGGINGFNVLSPEAKIFSQEPLQPVFSRLLLRGEVVDVGKSYDDRIILKHTPPYTQNLELSYNQNFLTLEFSALNYLNSQQTRYLCWLEGVDATWREISVSSGSESIKEGLLQVSYTNLSPGTYKFKVMASNTNERLWSSPVSTLHITINPPWWKTTLAYVLYTVFILFIIGLSLYLYNYFTRKKMERKHKEEMLLLRIKSLIEQYNLLEAEKNHSIAEKDKSEDLNSEDSDISNSTDSLFIAKAMELVEKNLDEPSYSVEQLSRDLCMDRTGLYRKLMTLLDSSPSLFIRKIRLQRAAQLIVEGELTITEIADRVGFSSSSYMSKCFQQEYGCRPSEYSEKLRKST